MLPGGREAALHCEFTTFSGHPRSPACPCRMSRSRLTPQPRLRTAISPTPQGLRLCSRTANPVGNGRGSSRPALSPPSCHHPPLRPFLRLKLSSAACSHLPFHRCREEDLKEGELAWGGALGSRVERVPALEGLRVGFPSSVLSPYGALGPFQFQFVFLQVPSTAPRSQQLETCASGKRDGSGLSVFRALLTEQKRLMQQSAWVGARTKVSSVCI